MQPTGVPGSLNLEYLLLRIQEWGQNLQLGGLPHGAVIFIEDLLILGMVLSLFFVILLMYVLIRLHQVEHEGFHLREHEGHTKHAGPEALPQGNARWDGIVALAYGTSQGDWRRAILEADIMLFDVLQEQGYPGATVGDQLKNANPIQMTTLDLAWKAHKMRNDIAHQGEAMELNERDVRATIDYYRRVFEEFGAV
jgi:hypothetical protein